MASAGDRILLVEDDPDISDLIARQTLIPVGYSVDVAADSAAAIKQALLTPPDLIIANLNLTGLTAKDLLVAFAAQGINTPVLVVAGKGQEQDIIQAFRLGAADYLLWPSRDAEVLAAVERVLSRVHEIRDRQRLDQKLSEVNQQLQRRGRELTAILNVGKAVASITDHRFLFRKIVEGLIQVSEADIAWLLIRDEESKQFLLVAQRGLPEGWARKMNMPLDDGISSLVALSGETLAISGEPLVRFRVANLGKSACVVPIKIQREVIGMSVVVRKDTRPFEKMEQTLLEAISDYASIALLNARLFRALNTDLGGSPGCRPTDRRAAGRENWQPYQSATSGPARRPGRLATSDARRGEDHTPHPHTPKKEVKFRRRTLCRTLISSCWRWKILPSCI